MAINVKEYIEFCSAYRQIKPTRHLLHGELQSLLLSIGPRQDWTIDFITSLLPSKLMSIIFNTILVIVDRYTKFTRYILSCKDWKAETLKDTLVRKMWSKCDLLVFLMTDRGSLFISEY